MTHVPASAITIADSKNDGDREMLASRPGMVIGIDHRSLFALAGNAS
jgi:hypothetical protein